MAKRKPLSKKTRFEVFKRDGFICGYCGSHPPSVVLEVDHILAVASGGDNSEENLITSCFDCNRGKGARSLNVAPQSLKEKSDIIKEKEEQITEYKKILSKRKRRINKDIKLIEDIFSEASGYNLSVNDKLSLKMKFFPKLHIDDIEESMEISAVRYPHNANRLWKYFCGICWNKIKGTYDE